MADLRATKIGKRKVFQLVITSIILMAMGACSNNKSANSVKWAKSYAQVLNPSDLLKNADDKNGANASGYVALGLISLKSLERAQSIAFNKKTRLEDCENVTPATHGDGKTAITVSVSDSGKACKGWSNSENLSVTMAGGALTSLSKSDQGQQPQPEADGTTSAAAPGSGLSYNADTTTSFRPGSIGLSEQYTMTQTDKSKAVYTFTYHGDLDYKYMQIVGRNRDVFRNPGISPNHGGTQTGGTQTGSIRQSADVTPDSVTRPVRPNPHRTNQPTPHVITGQSYENIAKIDAKGSYDLTNPDKPQVILQELTVAVKFRKGASDKDMNDAFSSSLELTQATAAMPTTCGVPEGGQMAFKQTFSVEGDSRNGQQTGEFHPVYTISNNKLTSGDNTTTPNLLFPCVTTTEATTDTATPTSADKTELLADTNTPTDDDADRLDAARQSPGQPAAAHGNRNGRGLSDLKWVIEQATTKMILPKGRAIGGHSTAPVTAGSQSTAAPQT